MCRHGPRRSAFRSPAAFTLVELLVVIGIISVLIALLMPTLSGARRSALNVKCQSNIRQICIALHGYAAENKGKFPPNVYALYPPPPGNPPNVLPSHWWYDADRIGRFMPKSRLGRHRSGNWLLMRDSLIGGAMACPADEGGTRSYAMNWWASSRVTNNNAGPQRGHPAFAISRRPEKDLTPAPRAAAG